jgi:hypothetical protein
MYAIPEEKMAIGFYFLSETLIYSTVQRENVKSVSFQGLSQCGINDVPSLKKKPVSNDQLHK